ncbi:RING finger protein 215 [Platysternon megacephalum]|uniref:RING finger protein 215 n=1 Tax=Platysternon megacephalum TaxID=55544 RepID=A0A4D9DWX9_9SAUR|nr:RING finger protein 215 [Platysternon megacephalum]
MALSPALWEHELQNPTGKGEYRDPNSQLHRAQQMAPVEMPQQVSMSQGNGKARVSHSLLLGRSHPPAGPGQCHTPHSTGLAWCKGGRLRGSGPESMGLRGGVPPTLAGMRVWHWGGGMHR